VCLLVHDQCAETFAQGKVDKRSGSDLDEATQKNLAKNCLAVEGEGLFITADNH